MTYTAIQFVETQVFTREAQDLLSDDELRMLQALLGMRPNAGRVIPGTKGLRKLRWRPPNRGKRGGLRVIYYRSAETLIYLLFIYRKSRREALSSAQLKLLGKLVQENLR